MQNLIRQVLRATKVDADNFDAFASPSFPTIAEAGVHIDIDFNLVRPPEICNFDDPEHPTRFDNLVETIGASKVDYYGKTRCCGSFLGITDEELALKMSKDILLSAKNSGANCLATACSLCHINLDARQKDIESRFDIKINLPVLYFTQLIGLALGIELKQLGLQRNCVSPRKIYPLNMTSG